MVKRWIFPVGLVAVVPASVWAGLKLKDYTLSRDLDKISSKADSLNLNDTALRASVVRLARERKALLEEMVMVDEKIRDYQRIVEREAAKMQFK
ncbi:hypothetical protein BD324DRAFT_637424 [Kockovaella imperatae]|uniref:Uncharacterized protein n=1 Tax=Kockovaella imperatae TaxID=4999 RepID=A0A1Y1U8E8_9TREE|nr:hypothetical protein BD324DRAFT_637424 [Kockovaella imperatae]ORX34293.1 hypothetical protein BD324DRAFT_637424 [Kockovaella imperatae]